jgi:serine/threonine protein kinase
MASLQNFLVDSTGHVKLTDFGLATGALNPKRIESLKVKVMLALHYAASLFSQRLRSSTK